MIYVNPVEIEGNWFTAVRVALPKTNLLVVSNDIGYIMCAALDVDILNTALADREVIAGRARGVRSIDDLLEAPLELVTDSAKNQFGWAEGMKGKDALLKLTQAASKQ